VFAPRPRREAISSRLRPKHKVGSNERGSVAVSIILIPLAFFAVFATIQIALVIHGRNVVTAAAEDGLYAAAQFGAKEDDGKDAAKRILSLHNGLEVSDGDIDVAIGDETVTVTIKGRVTAPLNFFNDFEIATQGPAEKFYLESER